MAAKDRHSFYDNRLKRPRSLSPPVKELHHRMKSRSNGYDGDEPDLIISSIDDEDDRPYHLPKRWIGLLAILFAIFLIFHNAIPLYTDWLWFGEVGQRTVFTTTILAKTILFALFGIFFFVVFYGNVRLARRLAPEFANKFLMERFGPNLALSAQKYLGIGLLLISTFLSLWVGRLAAESWASWLEFSHATPFGKSDPVFGKDIGFYIFRLPFLNSVYGFLLGTLIISAIAVVVIHVADRAIESWAGLPNVRPGVRRQLLALAAGITGMLAVGTRLGAFDLLTNDNGVFVGAGYTDLHIRLLALNLQTVLLVATSIICLVSMWRGTSFRFPVYGLAAWLGVLLLGNVIAGSTQKFSVEPNQFTMEQSYIQRNIQFTRQAFGLENVQRIDSFPADQSLTASQVSANRDTLDNVRLWDYPYLGKVYSQLQTIKPYYKFEAVSVGGGRIPNIDIDRYEIGGKLRQVMLAAREMDTDALPEGAQTWQNQRLGYTHGYGLMMSPVNRTLSGDPDYFVQGFPPTPTPEAANIKITHPEIYYGQLGYDQVYVDTQQQEFDYPSGGAGATAGSNQDHYTSYAGRGGIRIGDSYLKKLAFASRLGDWNLLLASNLKPESRILFRRDIRDRLQTIAPFVQQDGDPYIVVNPDDGRLVWITDCYTMSDKYPYSTPQSISVNPSTFIAPNYVRNSIKATIDAYDGTVHLYISDPNDPIARTYQSIYPGLLEPITKLPAGLRAHLRYPEDMFRLQRSVYATYHVDDPRVFYLKEDAWAVPNEPNMEQGTQTAARQMEPYYVIMRLPDVKGASGGSEEFVLMSPLAPVKREDQNILGWMCARCDGEHYGELVLYRFPQSASTEGPSQVVQRINSDKVISPQLSLLRSGGSTATLGNLLVIPVEKSLLYIAPLYVESTNSVSKLPKLQKVIVAFGSSVVMEDTLDKALAALFPGGNTGGSADSSPDGGATNPPDNTNSSPPQPNPNVTPQLRTLIDRATKQYDAAQIKLKQGDFAGYGTVTKQLQETLTALRRAAGVSNK